MCSGNLQENIAWNVEHCVPLQGMQGYGIFFSLESEFAVLHANVQQYTSLFSLSSNLKIKPQAFCKKETCHA